MSVRGGGFERFPNINFRDIEIKHELGSGSFGTVSKGMFDGKMVVVKKRNGRGEYYKKLVIKECDILERTRHENIAEFRFLDLPFIVREVFGF